jgi:hypothetical protein
VDALETFVDELMARTEGNPFYVTEAMRLVATQRSQRPELEAWTFELPPEAREVIRSRLDRLSPECRRLLGIASVIGQEFDVALLERAAEVRPIDLLAVLDEAAQARVVSEMRDAVGRFGFAHPLIRETLYAELSLDQQVARHQRIGETLEELHEEASDEVLAELAHHFYRAAAAGQDTAKAVAYCRRAAESGGAHLAYEEAVRLYQAAVQVLECALPVDRGQRAALRVPLGWFQRRSRVTKDDAAATLMGAIEDARAARDPELFARAATEYTTIMQSALPSEQSIGLMEEALGGLGEGSPGVRALALGQMASLLSLTSERERRRQGDHSRTRRRRR